MVASVFVEQIQKIGPSSPILNAMEPGMLLEVLLTLKDLKRSAELDFHISKLTMSCCRKHKELTLNQLHQLTDVLYDISSCRTSGSQSAFNQGSMLAPLSRFTVGARSTIPLLRIRW